MSANNNEAGTGQSQPSTECLLSDNISTALQHTTPPPVMAEDFNISRSGRVRKKSSKLSDYQSADDLEHPRSLKRLCVPGQPPDQLLASEDEDLDTEGEDDQTESRLAGETSRTQIIKKMASRGQRSHEIQDNNRENESAQ